MKNIISLFVLTFLFMSGIRAQENTIQFQKSNAVKINPAAFGNAEFQITYERYFGNRSSSISILPSIILKESPEQTKEGWQMMGQYKFFLTHLNKDEGRTFWGIYNIGFYAGVYGLYFDYNEDFLRSYWDQEKDENVTDTYKKEIISYEVGAMLGVQVDITKRILFDFYIGGGIRNSDVTDTYLDVMPQDYYYSYSVFDPEYKGVKPEVGFHLGITF